MRSIVNALITFAVFWVSSNYFSEHVHIDSTKTMILATCFMVVISYLFTWLFVISLLAISVGVGCVTSVILFIIGLVLTPVKLLLLSAYLPGFEVSGFWTYVILTVILSVFKIRSRTKQKDGDKS
ncbi:phage holin family protein [Paenibacillus sp. GCM10023248]|uniref:phage holin family protein n=1 Tax=unclassified Paenibacillus TaxID=185978 RepID=UPI00361DB41C